MPASLEGQLVVALSSRALFDFSLDFRPPDILDRAGILPPTTSASNLNATDCVHRNGFNIGTPKRLKSPTFRVTTVSLCTSAVAAIIASS